MRSLLAFAVIVFVSSSALQAQLPDESEVVRKSDWDGMRKIAVEAQKAGDNDLAKRKFLEAWSYASFWAVYDPRRENSGSNRASGIKGMETIRTAAAGLGLDETFRELDQIRAENPPQVFSGGKDNTGLWHVEKDQFFTLKQHGSYVVGTLEIEMRKGEKVVLKLEGKGFDGSKMQVELSTPGNPKAGRLVGELTLNGNRLAGTLKNPASGGELPWGIDRAWVK